MPKEKKKDPAAQELGRRGGLARAKALTPIQRQESARRAGLISKGKVPPPSKLWLVLDPVADNPIECLFNSPDRSKARAWAKQNRPDAFITSLDTGLFERGFGTLGGFHREYAPDTQRQVKALKTLIEAVGEDGK